MTDLSPQVIDLPTGTVTVMPDVISNRVAEAIPPGWLGTADEPAEVAAIRREFERLQRLETEDVYRGYEVRHFEGGSVILAPEAAKRTRIDVLLYGLRLLDGRHCRVC